jgi:type II secretory pathway component PulM
MRRTAVEMGALAALLLGGALACAQSGAPPVKVEDKPKEVKVEDKPKEAPAKSKLEEMLQQALQNNPDLRLATAKVAEAEAELNRARLLVVQKVGAAYQAVEAQKAAVEGAAAEFNELKTIARSGAASNADMRAAEQKLLDAKAKLAALETELPYLIGKLPANNTVYPGTTIPLGTLHIHYAESPDLSGILSGINLGGGALGVTGRWYDLAADADGRKPVPIVGPTADRIRAALDKPFSLELKDKELSEVIATVNTAFQKANPGLLLNYNLANSRGDVGNIVSIKFEQMPFGAVLEWIEDSVLDYRFVVRDYGLVMTSKDELPPGAPLLREFWKGAKEEDKAPAKDQSSNPPAKYVHGVVKSVDSAGLVQISIGSDAGIAKGNTVEVYRLNAKAPEQSKYLGRIKIVGATATSAVGQPMGKMVGTIQVGDQVSSRILGD